MARQIIDIGIQGNDGTGDSIRESFRKVNDNFTQLFALFGSGETIALTDLDDTPEVYQPSEEDRASILVADTDGTALLSKVLVGGDGIVIDNSDPNQVTIIGGGGGELFIDQNPTLGAHLNANGFNIGNISAPEDAVAGFNNLYNNGLEIAKADDFVISRGYADRRYLQANTRRAGTIGNQVRVRDMPDDTSEYTLNVFDWVGGFLQLANSSDLDTQTLIPHGFNTAINGSGFKYGIDGNSGAFPLISGTTYYLRYVDEFRLAVYDDRDIAINDTNLTSYIRVNIDTTIAKFVETPNTDTIFGSSISSSFEYTDLPVTSNGIGTGMIVNVTKTGTGTFYNSDNVTIEVVSRGDDYVPLELITISGDLLGGVAVTNDLTFTLVDQYRGKEELVDEYFDETLQGNWVGNEALPRSATVRRQGDDMEGLLYLSDHPGSFSGVGSPNGDDDLQAATKLYVDQSSFASSVNLFVATTGSDTQTNIPLEKQGRALSYAFASVNKACERAEEIINASLREPGPYRQLVTYLDGALNSYVSSSSALSGNRRSLLVFTNGAGVDPSKNPNNRDLREGSIIKGLRSGATGKVVKYTEAIDSNNDEYIVELLHTITDPNYFQSSYIISADLLRDNIDFIIEQVILFIRDSNPALAQVYDEAKCIRDLTYILDALIRDVQFGGNKGVLEVAKAYFRGAVRSLPFEQLDDTVAAIDYARQLITEVLQNNNFTLDPAVTPPDFGWRAGGVETQTITSIDGEQGTIPLVNRLFGTILDILESNDGEGSGILLDFQDDEELEYGQLVPEIQITIRVESGVYYEQLPIRVSANVSIKGDEFRRSIIRPALGESQSKWSRIYFYRESEFDGLKRSYTSTASANNSVLGQDFIITVSSTLGLEEGMYLKKINGLGTFAEGTRVKQVIDSTRFSLTLPPVISFINAVVSGFNTTGLAPEGFNFGYHYLTDPTDRLSRPKDNKDMDIFLMNDATILRNISCQGHGGFMTVLDPEGQILSKSPYIQTATSLSGSINKQRFAGGMLIDGSSGNLPATISSKTNPFELVVSGLNVRLPQVPTSFYIEGRRYQVNQVEPTGTPGEATVFLDAGSNPNTSDIGEGYDETQFTENTGIVSRDIVFQTAGNRSMLANDYTQVNDLGYGCIALNNGISELVSVFTYYCWTSYYAVKGGQIRSTQGNSSYGEYGMRAAGRDPTEVPDPVVLVDNSLQVAKIYKIGEFAGKNIAGDISVYIDNYKFVPYNISEIEIDFSQTRSSLVDRSTDFPNNIQLVNAGTGYSVGQRLRPVGGEAIDNSFTELEILTISGGGATGPIASFRVFNVGNYSTPPITLKQSAIFNTSISPTSPPGGSGAQFRGTYVGTKVTYEVNSIELTEEIGSGFNQLGATISLPVLKLNLQSNTNSALFADLLNEQTVIIRSLQNFRFNGVEEVRPVRPSTALEFNTPEESGAVYRTLTYNLIGPVGEVLADNEAILTFDTSYDYVIFQTNPSKLTNFDYVTGAPKTMGANLGDTKIAVDANSIDARDVSRLNSGNMLVAWAGKLFRVVNYVAEAGSNSAYVTLADLGLNGGSVVNTPTIGLSETLPVVQPTNLKAGIQAGIPADITVRISTCRASGHDFLDVGSGGFVTSNYPNNLYGAPSKPKNQSNEVVEEGEGRVFYASTDQDGIFRVGRFFTVDQGSGTVSFAASIALSNLDGIGFKRGTVIKEFSTDDSMTDAAADTVPTEGAVVRYISRRLGLTPEGTLVPNNQRIPQNSGFLAVTGVIPMTGDLNMGTPSNRIINLAIPDADSDAATKGYVDLEISKFDELSELRDVTITTIGTNQTLIYNGTDWVNSLITNNSVDASAAIVQSKLSLTAASTRANATGITQADLGVASFDSANFETTNGWVGIKPSGISYSEIQNVTANRILGNLSGSAAAPQELTPSNVLIAGIDTANIDSGATVLTARRNRLNLGAISTISGTGSGSSTYSNVPATSTTGTGSGARFNVTVTGGTYSAVSVVYGGSGYANGNVLTIDGALLGGASAVNNLNITVGTANIDTSTLLGIQNVSIAAEPNAIVSTDSTGNLGKIGNRFNTIYATNLSATSNIDSDNLYVDEFVRAGVDVNVIATGSDQASAYQITRSITVVTSQPAGAGIKLPNGTAQGGTRILIRNSTLLSLNVYPNSGAQINTQGNNVVYPVDPESALEFFSVGPDQWYTLSATLS